MSALPEIDIVNELKKLFKRGYIKSKRSDNTGIGYTLETLLKIKENNIAEPDFTYNKIPVELKAQRTTASSRVTLITKTPHWKPLKPKEIIEKFGYVNGKGRMALKVILTATKFNAKGFKLEVDEKNNKLNIVHKNFGTVAYFDITELMNTLRAKLYENLLLVLADRKRENEHEYFLYKKAILLKDLSEKTFEQLFNDGKIVWEFRMHLKPNGTVRDHGPGFRISRKYIDKLYSKKEIIFDSTNISEEQK